MTTTRRFLTFLAGTLGLVAVTATRPGRIRPRNHCLPPPPASHPTTGHEARRP